LDQQIADHRGQIGSPFRAVDTLLSMERRGTITRALRDAGAEFRAAFHTAQLAGLKAADIGRLRVSGGGRPRNALSHA
jgi:hypothetical protein